MEIADDDDDVDEENGLEALLEDPVIVPWPVAEDDDVMAPAVELDIMVSNVELSVDVALTIDRTRTLVVSSDVVEDKGALAEAEMEPLVGAANDVLGPDAAPAPAKDELDGTVVVDAEAVVEEAVRPEITLDSIDSAAVELMIGIVMDAAKVVAGPLVIE